MLHISLFSGMGGFDLASEWMGWTNIVSCEINPFGNRLLEFYWPKAYHHNDIHTLTYEKINEELTARFGHNWRSDDIILTGGFPCQPYSMAGKRLGKEDERHLWPQMLRTIKEIKPRWVVGENVRGLLNWNGGLVFDEVCADLESLGYQVTAGLIPACATDAPHKRERIWIIAHSDHQGGGSELGCVPSKDGKVSQWDKDSEPCNTNEQPLKDSLRGGCLHGEPIQERTEDGEQWDISTRDSDGVRGESMAGTSTNTKHNGHSDRCEKAGGKKRGSQQGGVQQPKGMGGEWTSANTDDNGCTPQGTSSQTEGSRSRDHGKSEEWSEQTERTDRLPRLQQHTPHPHNKGLQGVKDEGENRGEESTGSDNRREHTTRILRPNWEQFPTESPVRIGNDGIPPQLDGITISKHRNESIKAAGNAVVPQVVYAIFKSIEAYEQSIKS